MTSPGDLDPELAELRRLEEAERAGSPGPAPAVSPAPGGGAGDQAVRLQRLAELRDRGVLSDADLAAERQRILNGY